MRTLVTFFILILQVRAEGWDDFTNNLATDLAPLVALFGEQATKQFLSESTSRLDNVIFAVAPLGILTAVVSVIRVLGSASLRAFVGRAQEGKGQAEAELCSSTSYDVCELWNNGGIARVFGRPQILECVLDSREVRKGTGRKAPERAKKSIDIAENNRINLLFYEVYAGRRVLNRPSAGIYKPQEYVQAFDLRERAPPRRESHNGDAARMQFAPNPNLSLNVGIKKPSRKVLCLAAIFGCALQGSVLGYAAWAVHVKGLRKEGQSAVDPYFWLTVTGTVLLVVGMFLCARLIEQSTSEKTYKLQKHMFWLQPGGQRVGDQTFEAFACSTNVKEYTTSWKEERLDGTEWRKRASVWLTTSTSMIGFVLQFTGLRGLHSSVALYQFAATLIMALIRSLLRTQRLKENENLLHDRELQGQIEGHELDWQALRIEDTITKGAEETLAGSTSSVIPPGDASLDHELCWSVIEGPPRLERVKLEQFKEELVAQLKIRYQAELATSKNGSAAWTSHVQASAGGQEDWDGKCANALVEWIARVEGEDPAGTPRSHQPNIAKKILCYRSRLSFLTNDDTTTTAQPWDLAVREQAIKLRAAIQSVANYIFSDDRQADMKAPWDNTAAFCWAMNCVTSRQTAVTTHPVHLTVRRVRGQWRIDICQLEAVLGLWTWSIKTEVEKNKKRKRRNTEEVEVEETESSRMAKSKRGATTREHSKTSQELAKDDDEESLEREEADYDRILSRKIFTAVSNQDLEARKRAERELNIWILREQRQPVYDNLDTQALTNFDTLKQEGKAFPFLSLPMARRTFSRTESEQLQNRQRQGVGVLSVQTENSVLVMATQDVFTSFVDALASITNPLRGVNVVQTLKSGPVAEEVVSSSKARPFLGLAHDHTERLVDLFIQAGLGSRDDALLSVITPFHSRSLLPLLTEEYEQLRSQAQKLRGDGRWEQAENLLIALCDGVESNPQDSDACDRSEELLRELGELYRKAMRSKDRSRRIFGYEGVCKMFTMRRGKTDKAEEIRQNYCWVAVELAKRHGERDNIPSNLQGAFKKTKSPLDPDMNLQDMTRYKSAYPIGLILVDRFEKQPEKEKQSSGRRLLMWAAQKGCKELVEDMLDAGVDANVCDENRRTPLSHACEQGYDELSEALIKGGAAVTADDDNCTPFTWAVRKGWVCLVQRFLGMNIDVDLKDRRYGKTPLWWAVENGHEAVVELLLQTGKVNVDAKDEKGRTLLSWAAQYGHEAVVKLLLQTDKVEVDAKTKSGRTSLLWAAENGHEAVVKLLLQTEKVDIDAKDGEGGTPLSWAVRNGHEAVVKLLLQTEKVDVNVKNEEGQMPLMWAIRNKHEAVVKLLLQTDKVDVNAKDEEGRTSLLWAARNGHKTVVRLLLQTDKVDLNAKDERGGTALSWAAQYGRETVVKLLLQTGKVDVNAKDKEGQMPLIWAIGNGHVAVVKLLLQTDKVDVDAKDEWGRTPLSWAAGSGRVAVVKLLLQTDKVDVNATDKRERTPLSWAAQYGQEAVAKLLLQTDVDADTKDKEGRTPLSWAAESGRDTVAKLLLQADVNADAKDKEGRTPLSWAAGKGQAAVVELLLQTDKVDVDSKDEKGWTPLLWAKHHRRDAVVKLLEIER